MNYTIEYLEMFGRDRYERPCEEAMRALEVWIAKRFGKNVTVIKNFRRFKGTDAWIIYDWTTKKTYLATIFCQSRLAVVKVKQHKPSRQVQELLKREVVPHVHLRG